MPLLGNFPPPKKNIFFGRQDFKLGSLNLDLYPNPIPGFFFILLHTAGSVNKYETCIMNI